MKNSNKKKRTATVQLSKFFFEFRICIKTNYFKIIKKGHKSKDTAMESATNFDKIINSSQNIVPKRLSFDFLNNTELNQSSKKRKNAEIEDQSKREELNESLNSSTSSICASWESKILRTDLIESQTRVF